MLVLAPRDPLDSPETVVQSVAEARGLHGTVSFDSSPLLSKHCMSCFGHGVVATWQYVTVARVRLLKTRGSLARPFAIVCSEVGQTQSILTVVW